jgi:N-acylneuraminate cytidylyltransferase/pseudaminic acid cytidylyltransferase
MNLCVIPARGGSKRIPKKNIKLFCDRPLIAYSIETAKESNLFDKIIVSTDSEEIAEVAKNYGAEIQMRPKELSDDYAGSIDVFDYVISQNPGFEYACMIYATAPFLKIDYLKKGLEELKNSNACYSFAAATYDFPVWRGFEIIDGQAKMFFPEYMEKRSQDLKEAYHDAGQFYWKRVNCTEKFRFDGNIPILLPRYLVQDIDTMEDFIRAEKMFKALKFDEFDKWNALKKDIHLKEKKVYIKEGGVYLVILGYNIGAEVYGKGKYFLRPVVILKKLTSKTFLGIPLTTKNNRFFSFMYKDVMSYAMFNQIRTFDIKRIFKYHGMLKRSDFYRLKEEFKKFISL